MTEPNCVQCGANAAEGYYDDRKNQYYCDEACFNDWADAHFEDVTEFYKRMNLN